MNTMQEEFDIVVRHLYTQGRPAMLGTQCAYRAGDLTCAVGCRIPDELYSPEMDNLGFLGGSSDVKHLLAMFSHRLPSEISKYREMFTLLQEVHDECKKTDEGNFDLLSLKERLEDVAETCRLNTKVLESLYEC